jgi:hypothetical protein
VSDVNVSQISAFNKDAPNLSVWVPSSRLHVERRSNSEAGRICAPTVVRLGDGPLPEETLVFERVVRSGQVTKPAVAELVITPREANLAEVTIDLVGLPEQWTQRDGTLTFEHVRPVQFPPRAARGLFGEGEGPPPADVFGAFPAYLGFAEPCQPVELLEDVAASTGVFDPRTEKVSARGIEPLRLPAGTRISVCDGASLDTLMVAAAKPATVREDETEASWFLLPRGTKVKPLGTSRFTVKRPLGGYHVCRQPAWTTAMLVELPLRDLQELGLDGRWRTGSRGSLAAGLSVTLLDYRDTWALIRAQVEGAPRIFAVPASAVAMPTGPAQDSLALDGGLCPVAVGQWRALKQTGQAFRVNQDTPGAELDGLWLEIPLGTHVLQLCQEGVGAGGRAGLPLCSPIEVGGTQAKENDRFVLVRYAGAVLAVRARDLRDRATDTYALREERPWFYRADKRVKRDTDAGWAFGLGPGARPSFVRADDHAWTLTARVQKLSTDTLGFEGAFGAGGDGFSTFVALSGGVGTLLYRFPDAPIELRASLLGELDLRVSRDGGLNVQVVGKAQMRWLNDYAPVNFELGLNLGYGGTFGKNGSGGVLLGMPISVLVEIVKF